MWEVLGELPIVGACEARLKRIAALARRRFASCDLQDMGVSLLGYGVSRGRFDATVHASNSFRRFLPSLVSISFHVRCTVRPLGLFFLCPVVSNPALDLEALQTRYA